MNESHEGVVPNATPLMLVFVVILLSPTLRAEATIIRNLRFGDNDAFVRMVLELDRPLNAPPSVSVSRDTLQVVLTGITDNLPDPPREAHPSGVVRLAVSQTPDATRIDAVLAFPPAEVKTFSLTGPQRFIIDAYRPPSPAVAMAPGEKAGQASVTAGTEPLPETIREPAPPQPAGAAPRMLEASLQRGDGHDFSRNRFQRRLMVALIVVTSILVVLLSILLWMGGRREKPQALPWMDDQTPTADRRIGSIDTAIGNHLKTHDRP